MTNPNPLSIEEMRQALADVAVIATELHGQLATGSVEDVLPKWHGYMETIYDAAEMLHRCRPRQTNGIPLIDGAADLLDVTRNILRKHYDTFERMKATAGTQDVKELLEAQQAFATHAAQGAAYLGLLRAIAYGNELRCMPYEAAAIFITLEDFLKEDHGREPGSNPTDAQPGTSPGGDQRPDLQDVPPREGESTHSG